jgi:GNAT superfamily N-acetyltransferase
MIEPASYSAIQTLREGRKIQIRALRPQDRDGLTSAVARVGKESLYRRFFAGKREFSEKEVSFFVDVDFVNHVALVAVAKEGDQAAIVGGGRYVVVRPGQAEVAFAVIDEYQGQGIGAALMRHLGAIARHSGLRELIAEVLSENVAMLKVFEKSGLEMSAKREGAVVHVSLRIP